MLMKTRNILYFGCILLTMQFFYSCGNLKDIVYLQNEQKPNDTIKAPSVLFDAIIKPKDVLSIEVKSLEPELAAPFNWNTTSAATTDNTEKRTVSAASSYLVNNDGYVDLAIIGPILVKGQTEFQAEKLVKDRLSKYLNNPNVRVRILNYKISVLGEVNRPGVYPIENGKINLLEALALAGDMTIYGNRQIVKLIREDKNGKKYIFSLNMTDPKIINSPYYYLQQGDILYIQPNTVKASAAAISDKATFWVSVGSMLVGVASIIVSIVK